MTLPKMMLLCFMALLSSLSIKNSVVSSFTIISSSASTCRKTVGPFPPSKKDPIVSASISSSSSSCIAKRKNNFNSSSLIPLSLSEWSDFSAIDDDDDYYNDDSSKSNNDINTIYADENDPQEYKAQIGSTIPPPPTSSFENVEPIFLPVGSILPLTPENVQSILSACRIEIGTMFGYTAENRGVGITGYVDYVDLDGPNVIISLGGRFWHQRVTVLERVEKYVQGRIPEVVSVVVEDPWELTDEANNAAY